MKLPERILLSLSRDPGLEDYPETKEAWTLNNSLDLLLRYFPTLKEDIVGKDILDFGCGSGWQSVAIAVNGSRYVMGLDINPKLLQRAIDVAKEYNVDSRVEFREKIEKADQERFDIVLSQNSMEHFKDPGEVLNQMKEAAKKDGILLITFGPPWFAPYGSHMHFFTKVPWVNILFSESTVMSVRRYFRSDGATKYEDVEGGLNRMSIAKFEKIINYADLKIIKNKYTCIKGMNFLGKLPLIKELFINHVSCVLAPLS